MNFNLSRSLEILEHTPDVLISLLGHISDDWSIPNEGPETWSVYDIVGHLIHGEKTDWIPRMKIILSDQSDKSFVPFDRFAQFGENAGATLQQLLQEFKQLRADNIKELRLSFAEEDLGKTGNHPVFGDVTLAQLLSTWTVHDLNHIAQISRVMARQYKEAVGPWTAYLGILQS